MKINNQLTFFSIFFGLLEMSLVNAHICYTEFNSASNNESIDTDDDDDDSFNVQNTSSKLPLLEFKRQVADGLIQMSKQKKKGRPSKQVVNPEIEKSNHRKFTATEEQRFMNIGLHFPVKAEKKGRCELCSVVHHRESRTTFKCIKCKTYLCLTADKNCFYDFHHQNKE
jgi:hypothetical protein